MNKWFENNGRMPAFCKGKRVYVELRNGIKPVMPWPADGRGAMDWRLQGVERQSREFDVIRFRLA